MSYGAAARPEAAQLLGASDGTVLRLQDEPNAGKEMDARRWDRIQSVSYDAAAHAEAAQLLGVWLGRVHRDDRAAKAWLELELRRTK